MSASTLSALVWLAAVLPACLWAALICLFWRHSRDPLPVSGGALAAGVVLAAWPSSYASQTVHNWFVASSGAAAPWAVSSIIVPGLEELFKAAALLLLSAAVLTVPLDVVRGIRRGALIGTGFAMLENTQYLTLALIQGGMPGLWRGAYVRGVVGGLAHALFAATVGASLGIAVQTSSRWTGGAAIVIGLSAAIAQHAVWNTLAAGTITAALCDPATSGGPCRLTPQPLDLFVIAPLIAGVALGPGIVALWAVAVYSRRTTSPRIERRGGSEG